MRKTTGFPPVTGMDPKVIILGSFPGLRSLAEGEYYAHPRNAFWRIMGILFGAGTEIPYIERLDILRGNGISLWDVLERCERAGSMDGAIVESTATPNDINGLLREHEGIKAVCFNGKKAAHLYKRMVLKPGCSDLSSIPIYILPSTSPAFASMAFEEKTKRWSLILGNLLGKTG